VQASLPAFEGYHTASDDELDSMRGGFEINFNGMQLLLAFSVEQLTYINGELVSSMKLNPLALISSPTAGDAVAASAPPTGSSGGNAGAQSVAPAAVASSQTGQAPVVSQVINDQAFITLVQNGAGNSFTLPESLNGLTTAIQNSVNDQVIRNITVMNATLSIQLDAAMARLNEAISQATAAAIR
jgi:hypothetical protein